MRFLALFLLLGSGLACAPARAVSEFPFRFADGMIWLKVRVPGRDLPLNFLLDSGAGSTVLDLKTGSRIGATLGRREMAQGAGGQLEAYRIKDFKGTFGNIALPCSVLAVDLQGVSAGLHQRIDGLLGIDFLKDRIVQIDFRSQKIRFLAPNELAEAGMEILPLKKRNDAFCVKASVAGQPGQWLRLDTGCRNALLWVANPSPRHELNAKEGAAGEPSSMRTEVQLGSLKLDSVFTDLHQKTMFRGESGLLGNGLLSKFTFTIDSVRGRLLLAK